MTTIEDLRHKLSARTIRDAVVLHVIARESAIPGNPIRWGFEARKIAAWADLRDGRTATASLRRLAKVGWVELHDDGLWYLTRDGFKFVQESRGLML